MKTKILDFVKKQGFLIESSEQGFNSLSFYCNDKNQRYFIKIKQVLK